jgi:hypothetical protein
MKSIKFLIFAFRLILSLGLVCGYSSIVLDMAKAAVLAQTQDSISVAKFNQMLWSGGRSQKKSNQLQGRRK